VARLIQHLVWLAADAAGPLLGSAEYS